MWCGWWLLSFAGWTSGRMLLVTFASSNAWTEGAFGASPPHASTRQAAKVSNFANLANSSNFFNTKTTFQIVLWSSMSVAARSHVYVKVSGPSTSSAGAVSFPQGPFAVPPPASLEGHALSPVFVILFAVCRLRSAGWNGCGCFYHHGREGSREGPRACPC